MADPQTGRLPDISRRVTGVRIKGADDSAISNGQGFGVTIDHRARISLPVIGTFLIDSPRDSSWLLRQQLLSYHVDHRGLNPKEMDQIPLIPYRLNYRGDNTSSSGSSRTSSIASDVQPVTEKVPRDASRPRDDSRPRLSLKAVNCTPASTPWYISTSAQGTDAAQPTRKLPPRCVFSTPRRVKAKGEITRLKCKSLSSCTSVDLSDRQDSLSYRGSDFKAGEFVVENALLIPEPVPCFQDPDGVQDLQEEKESAGLSEEEKKERADSARLPRIKQRNVPADDISLGKKLSHIEAHTITESVHLWRDTKVKQNQAPRYLENTSENFGPTSYFQNTKIKFVGDLLMPPDKGEDSKPTEMSDHHKRQRITQQIVRCENSIRLKGTLFSEDDEKAWLEIVNMQVIDHSDYDRFASKRKPSILEGVEVQCPESRPRNGADFKLTHPMNGKAYPIFFKDGKPMRKFGHATSRHKHSKLREGSITYRYF